MTTQTKRARSSSRRPDASKVHRTAAIRALAAADNPQIGWTQFIVEHWRLTGDLAPGCDMKDFLAFANAFTRAAARAVLGQSAEGLYSAGSRVSIAYGHEEYAQGVIIAVSAGDPTIYTVEIAGRGEQQITADRIRLAASLAGEEPPQC